MTLTRSKRRLGEIHASLHDRVKIEIRKRILGRRYKPGERLVEDHLAVEFGVSRNPVREALRALASEGLVEVTARRGAFVATMTEAEARETIDVRAMLEGQNARLATRRRDPHLLSRVQAVLDRGAAAVVEERFEALADLNVQFHQALANASGNRVLGELLKALRERTATLFSPQDPARQVQSWKEHAAILQAIVDGNEEDAAQLATHHVNRAGGDFLASKQGLGALPDHTTKISRRPRKRIA